MSKLSRESRGLFYQFYKLFSRREVVADHTVSIDVVIPVLDKDLGVLPLCIEGIRRCVNHTIDKIYVVAPRGEVVEKFCVDHGLVFVDEITVLGYSPKDIGFITDHGDNRSGWIFQQLLKLSGNIGENRYFLVIDADHVLLNPHTFISKDGKFVFYRSSEYHIPYYNSIELLTGNCDYGFFTLSYITHKMIFDKKLLESLKNMLSARSGKSWDRAIIDSLDSKQMSPFSEFELYGNYVPIEKKISLPWRTKSMNYTHLKTYDELKKRYGKKYLAITFPDYYNIK